MSRNAPPASALMRAATLALGVAGANASAIAQSANCDEFKARVAARIEAGGVRGYGLEFVPSSRPLPAGARSVGTCDGGAYTLMYRRWATEAAPAAAATTAVAASAAVPKPAPSPAAAAPSPVAPPRPSASPAAAPAPTPSPVPSPAPAVSPSPAPKPTPSPAPVAAPAASPSTVAQRQVAIEPTPVPTVFTPAAAASEPALRAPETAASEPPTAAPPPTPAAATAATGTPEATDDGLPAWLWALGVGGLLGGLALWRWLWRRSRYDEAGLPRGPRITL